jgi:pimeloyl-ACP methyl ester carboxylesterase
VPPTGTGAAADAVREVRASFALLTGRPDAVAAGLAVTRTGHTPGTAPAVLLVHGLGGARLHWAPVLAPLARRYDVLVVDLPGHGDSPPSPSGADLRAPALAARVAAAVAELGVRRPHVVANSLGGWTGLEMAADGAAASLTALAPAGLRIVPGEPSPLLRINRTLALGLSRFADSLVANTLVRRIVYASGSADPAGLDADVARGVAWALRRSTDYEGMLRATRHIRFERREDVRVPVTVAWGDRDHILPSPANQNPELAPAGCRWVVLPRCGHCPMWDAVPATLRLVHETVEAGEARGSGGAGGGDPA